MRNISPTLQQTLGDSLRDHLADNGLAVADDCDLIDDFRGPSQDSILRIRTGTKIIDGQVSRRTFGKRKKHTAGIGLTRGDLLIPKHIKGARDSRPKTLLDRET